VRLNQIGAGNPCPSINLQNLLLRVIVGLSTGTLGLISITLCLITLSAFAKEQATVAANLQVGEGAWTTYTVTHGLPSNTVWGGITVDDSGGVWAGFENGDWNDPLPSNELVSQLDGANWLNYELPGCRVRPLGAAENVYVGTYCPGPPSGSGGGLSAFIENTWVTFTPTDGMMGTYVSAIAPEGNTKVWVASGDNIFCYGYVNLLDHKGTADKVDDEWTLYTFGLCGIYAIAVDPQGNRWFGTSDGVRVLLADNVTWVIYSSDLIEFATDIAFDEMGNTWFARNDEVTRFNGDSWLHYGSREEAIENNFAAIMASIDSDQVNPHVLPGLWIVEEPAGVWIIRPLSDGGGVGFYDGQTWTIYNQEDSALGSNDVRGIAIDQQSNIWIGTRAGLPPAEGGLSKFTPLPKIHRSYLPILFNRLP
jgi:hypothetical protein